MIESLDAIINYLEVGRWMRANGYDINHRLKRREQLFDTVAARVA